ncbi:steroidogenic acute regulatory protein-like [Chelonus insularis]|uniref:steroidogenic acute regulatory protein-like n=1 Tax=Chelonus insularis TaxID=460826 RepID=UPI00158B6731|nr:steroidogenic acute regulatory protein-like [Chelonus insularis]XP_034939620.1 steroidogenic acute regulatory protein-like [Chelonus insularis]
MMTEEDRHIRSVAENLLSGSLQSQRSSYSHRSINSINRDFIVNEEVIAGARHNNRMSSTRRFFCLLVTFDLLLTCLMWLLCTTIAGENISTAFVQQVLHYNISTSLFDIVFSTLTRFIVLLFFYALLQLNHWIIVALTTASTSAFLGAKVYFFTWDGVPQPGFQALLILISFVLAWAEAWYFDYRVVPQEMQAQYWMNSVNNERSPLLQNVLVGPPSRIAESVGNFFTPMDSPTHSDDDEDHTKSSKSISSDDEFFNIVKRVSYLSPIKFDEYKRKASLLVDQSYQLLISKEWQKHSTTTEGDIISVMDSSHGKIFKIEGIVEASAQSLINQLHDNVEDTPTWNKDVSVVQKVQNVDHNTDIIYQSTKTYGGGLVGPRDFITLRHRNRCGKYYLSSGTFVNTNLPTRKNHIRAENKIVCLAAESIEDDESSERTQCRVTWILHVDLKGWLPQRVIDKSLASMLEKMIKSIRDYLRAK